MVKFLPRFRDDLLSGRKTATSRTRRIGKVGDTFTAFGETFELTAVNLLPAGYIVRSCYEAEGFKTATEFLDCWVQIHPRIAMDRRVYYHQFKKRQATP